MKLPQIVILCLALAFSISMAFSFFYFSIKIKDTLPNTPTQSSPIPDDSKQFAVLVSRYDDILSDYNQTFELLSHSSLGFGIASLGIGLCILLALLYSHKRKKVEQDA